MSRITSYTVGLTLAIILTIVSFSLVFAKDYALPVGFLLPTILVLAMIQLVLQLVFFLHLGRDKESRWNTALFSFTFFGILVIVIASIWIMYHLNYNHMSHAQVNQYIENQSGI